MKKLITILMLIVLFVGPIQGQLFLSGGFGKIMNYSEWVDPTIFEEDMLWQYNFELGYQIPSGQYWVKYLSLGYEKRVQESKSYASPSTISPTSTLVEESIPLSFRLAWSHNYFQLGAGPLLMVTRQTITHPIWNSADFKESIVILSPGCSVQIRSNGKSQGEPGPFAQIEGRVAHSIVSFGEGVDVSEYSHYYSVIGVSVGMQF